jgi:hypothetical protein
MFNALIKKETINVINNYVEAIAPFLPEKEMNELKGIISEPRTMVLISSVIDIYSQHLKPETMEFMYQNLIASKPAMQDLFQNMNNIIPEISALIEKMQSTGVQSEVEG